MVVRLLFEELTIRGLGLGVRGVEGILGWLMSC